MENGLKQVIQTYLCHTSFKGNHFSIYENEQSPQLASTFFDCFDGFMQIVDKHEARNEGNEIKRDNEGKVGSNLNNL